MQLLSIINFTASIQGIFLSYLLFNKRSESREYRALGFLVLVMSIGLLGAVLGLSGYYKQFPHLMRIGDPMGLLLGPLLYLYIYLLTRGETPKRFYFHLVPFVLYVVSIIPFYTLSAEEKIAFGEKVFLNKNQSALALAIQVARTIHVMVYVVLSLALIKRFDKVLEKNFSEIEKINLHKCQDLLRLYVVVCAIAIVIFIAVFFIPFHLVMANNLVGLGISLLIYILAYVSWGQQVVKVNELVPVEAPQEIEHQTPFTAYSGNENGRITLHLSDEQYQNLSKRLEKLLDHDKVYLENELSLAQLSKKLNIVPYLASELINRKYQESFFDLINRHRIEEVKKRLTDPAFAYLSIFGVAVDCGFNSKSSFNTAFKKFTSLTPSQYRVSK
ncbi:AraC-type DNA-binding protein [Ohtaekwangia koreensis]|uniref:AraC-type DNA-binding protein n=2 Tax=Ohtaekwangia koreensis TaxID=688867 RepID=A0A1T5KIP2_9BACT|nr:AraC-type DNA-binding protein [Ohtaekwangia koreensis]